MGQSPLLAVSLESAGGEVNTRNAQQKQNTTVGRCKIHQLIKGGAVGLLGNYCPLYVLILERNQLKEPRQFQHLSCLIMPFKVVFEATEQRMKEMLSECPYQSFPSLMAIIITLSYIGRSVPSESPYSMITFPAGQAEIMMWVIRALTAGQESYGGEL